MAQVEFKLAAPSQLPFASPWALGPWLSALRPLLHLSTLAVSVVLPRTPSSAGEGFICVYQTVDLATPTKT